MIKACVGVGLTPPQNVSAFLDPSPHHLNILKISPNPSSTYLPQLQTPLSPAGIRGIGKSMPRAKDRASIASVVANRAVTNFDRLRQFCEDSQTNPISRLNPKKNLNLHLSITNPLTPSSGTLRTRRLTPPPMRQPRPGSPGQVRGSLRLSRPLPPALTRFVLVLHCRCKLYRQ